MKPLSLAQLNSVNPEKIYDLPLVMNINLWNKIKLPSKLPPPIKLSFNDTIRDNMSSAIKYKKGVYMFVVEPEFPFAPEIVYLIYIGRVMKGNTFFKRFLPYVNTIGNINAKRNTQLMTNSWPDKTSVFFYPMINDKHIEIIEEELIDKIIPPLNNKFYLEEAQNTRSLYK